jgi:hypothetical protein
MLTASVSETIGIFTMCRRSEESNTVHMRHTQNGNADHERWAISTAPIFSLKNIHIIWYSNVAYL